jgi:hypothetical protein
VAKGGRSSGATKNGAGNGRTDDPAVAAPVVAPPVEADGAAPDRTGAGAAGSSAAGPDGATAKAPGADAPVGDAGVREGPSPAPDGAEPAAPPDEVTTTQMRVPTPARESQAPGGAVPAVDRPAEAPGDAAASTPVQDAAARDGRAEPKSAPKAGATSAPTSGATSASALDTVRIPTPVGSGVPVNGAGPTAGPSTAPEPVEPVLDPVPAPAVPAPGPDAAQPPPWRRVSDRDGRVDGNVPVSTTDRFLDEGPTAFLEVPRSDPSPNAGDPAPTDTGSWSRIRSRPPRQAALQLKRLDPWSVLKLALVLAVVLFFIWLVAVGVLYGVLDGMGVWDRLNGTYADLVSGEAAAGDTLISAGRVFGLAAVVGAINSLLFAVAVTVGAFVYNVSADLVGGIEVTLSERD